MLSHLLVLLTGAKGQQEFPAISCRIPVNHHFSCNGFSLKFSSTAFRFCGSCAVQFPKRLTDPTRKKIQSQPSSTHPFAIARPLAVSSHVRSKGNSAKIDLKPQRGFSMSKNFEGKLLSDGVAYPNWHEMQLQGTSPSLDPSLSPANKTAHGGTLIHPENRHRAHVLRATKKRCLLLASVQKSDSYTS